jgi:hypothetical protein
MIGINALMTMVNFDVKDEKDYKKNMFEFNPPQQSYDPINDTNVFLYKNGLVQSGIPTVYRGLETINITYDDIEPGYYGSGFTLKANITLQGGLQFNLTMNAIPGSSNRFFTCNFTPSIVNNTGLATIAIMAISNPGEIIINSPLLTDRTINILNNLPSVGVSLNATEFYRGENIMLNFTPSDVENNLLDLKWRVALYGPDSQIYQTFVDQTYILGYIHPIPTNYLTGQWKINATCWDKDNGVHSLFYYIQIKNNKPIIDGISFFVNNVEKIGDISVLRVKDLLTVNVSVTDLEDKYNLLMTFEAKDIVSGTNVLLPATSYQGFGPIDAAEGLFSKNITFPRRVTCGRITLKIKVYESGYIDEYYDEYSQLITVANNPPVILNFSVNGLPTNQSLGFTTNDQLNFTFSLYDAEASIRYVKIIFYHEEGQLYINYTTTYVNNNTVIVIRAVDIPTGDYIVYIVVTDDAGATVQSLPLIMTITIDESVDPVVWLLFGIGLILGVAITAGVMYWRKRFASSVETSTDFADNKEIDKSEKTPKKGASSDKKKIADDDEPTKVETEKKSSAPPKKKLIRKL